MTATLVDTNVLLDVINQDPIWDPWSIAQLDRAASRGPLVINDIVFAELSVRYAALEDVDEILATVGVQVKSTPRSALFVAGKAFQQYRTLGGSRTGVLADFFIGAHALIAGYPLLTRDARRYRTYFPRLELITP